MKLKNILLFCLFFCATAAQVNASWQGFIFANTGYGQLSGLAQTPKGGSPGTTRFNRPTFDEANIKHNIINELAAGIDYCDYFAVLDYRQQHVHGNKILTEDLITHAKFIPQGSPFNMHIQYDWIAMWLGKAFSFNQNQSIVSPFLAGNWIKYQYDFVAPSAQSGRHFSISALTAGIAIEHYFDDRFSLDAMGQLTMPINNVRIYDATVGVNYHFVVSPHLILSPRLGLLATYINYEDEQTVPNHIQYRAKPHGMLGLTAKFI
ncbi:MAG: hypothetical protein ACHQJ6_00625 [Candidatus Berkiellales bacterium]